MDFTMNLNDYFDHIYCINLDFRTDRWEQCLAEFEKHGIKDVERISATSAADINFPINVKPGEAGLINTHTRVIQDVIDKNYQRVLILEDDVEFADTIHDCLESIPDNWQVVYFGGNHHQGAPHPINDKISIANRTLAMHCIALTRDVCVSMIPKINYNEPIDVTYSNMLYLFNSYVFTPSQAWQKPSHSDLMGHFVDYGFLR